MKSLILLLTISIGLFGAHIDEFASSMGYYRDYTKALNAAKKENKVVMLVVVGDFCPWCKKFERKTLQNANIAININKNFIPLIVDKNYDKDNFPKIYNAKRIPTVYFIEPKSESMVFESLGYVKKDEFQDTLEIVHKKHKKEK